MSSSLPAPLPTPDAGSYWQAAQDGRLSLQHCSACAKHRFPPRALCPYCQSTDMSWVDASGDGIVHSFTIVHRAPSQAFRAVTPYVIALVDLAEGARMMTNIVGPGALDVAIGDAVEVTFEARGEQGEAIPQFKRKAGQ